MTNDHDTAMSDFVGELFARASDPAQATQNIPAKSNHVPREGTLTNPAPKDDRDTREFVRELFGLDA